MSELELKVSLNLEGEKSVQRIMEKAFRAGFSAGERNGKFDDDNEDDAWKRFVAEMSPTEEPRGPLTLDDISKRINTICDDLNSAAGDARREYEASLDVLAAEIDAMPDLDKDAVGAIVLGRVNRMMVEMQKAFGQ